jgi:hypothetical protein
MKRTFALFAVAGLAGALSFGAQPSAQTAGRCSSGAAAPSRGSHAYFEALAARPDCMAAFSLRDAAQLDQYTHSKRKPHYVTYDPANDPDPRRQDAAKIAVPAGKVSLPNQVRLPIGTSDGTTTLVTWDAWFGSEFRFDNTGIGTYKTFQFASPADRIWFEVRTKFKQDEARNRRRASKVPRAKRARAGSSEQAAPNPGAAAATPPPPTKDAAPRAKGRARRDSGPVAAAAPPASGDRVDIGVVDARGYGAGGTTLGPNVLRGAPLAPQAGSFTIRAETWTRYWVLIEQRANDWDLMSLWVADEDHDPVQLIDRLQFNVKKSVDSFWLEYNTSSHPREGLGQRVGYVRNVVMLRNAKDVASLLQRPVK